MYKNIYNSYCNNKNIIIQSPLKMHTKQTQQSPPNFDTTLKLLYNLIDQQNYKQCMKILQSYEKYHENCQNQNQNAKEEAIEIKSLKGYICILLKQYQKALGFVNQCLKIRPFHLTSKKRKAIILEKLGDHQQALKEFQNCLYLEPQSKSLRNKMKRLNRNSTSAKSQSVSSQGNTYQQKNFKYQMPQEQYKSISKNKIEQQFQVEGSVEIQKKEKTPTVKFGKFEIIQIMGTQDSDQHFALIKQQINKLSDKKPKKSILKDSMSASIFKQKPNSSTSNNSNKNPSKQKQYQFEPQLQNQQQKSKTSAQLLQKQAKTIQKLSTINIKKKAKSVTFKGDTNLQDFN